ncbi:MAG TPA: Spy/CpxP family protein refolding chaperone [Syntrophales bacterium]|nr:Spy/CpxP family protein refolding chaperone [Syntrophales bacterium]HOM06359.1 Spy/CpxP family protein refolding chaperone [Syntrophales bacterium]HON99190.1 Spy/CpxP family protein refolding chaperone [Syntrophales bacterium]HPC00298.1 Spy/CpxP family protein refolding chaperone [Syntrophales bacterium]HPQ05961.1 Spy/CpxP family protein refolding chaperone [Syntrophales bacterium]
MKRLMASAAVLALIAVLAAAPAEARRGWWEGYPGGGYQNLANHPDLNLTADQVGKLNSLRETHLRETKPIRDQLFAKEGDLRLLWLQQNPDEKKIRTLQKEIRALRDQLEEKNTHFRLEQMKVLTPEQRERLKALGPGRGLGPGKGPRGYGGMGMRPF